MTLCCGLKKTLRLDQKSNEYQILFKIGLFSPKLVPGEILVLKHLPIVLFIKSFEKFAMFNQNVHETVNLAP